MPFFKRGRTLRRSPPSIKPRNFEEQEAITNQVRKMSLPPANTSQAYVAVAAILAGRITAPKWSFIDTNDMAETLSFPCLAFLITREKSACMTTASHVAVARKSPEHILFDLGLREERRNYTDDQQAHIKNREPVAFGPSVATTLQKNGMASTEIDWVIYSHVHWDHTGEPSDFPNASFIIGHGSSALLKRGFDAAAGSHAAFDTNLLDHREVFELLPNVNGGNADDASLDKANASFHSPWTPLGPFPAAMDILGDGSVYVIPSPGHLQGHINLLCRVEEKRWIYLGGDTFHHRSLLTGEAEIATWRDTEGRELCVHTDRAAAQEMFALLRKLQDQATADGVEVEIITSHDQDWYNANQDRLFPEKL